MTTCISNRVAPPVLRLRLAALRLPDTVTRPGFESRMPVVGFPHAVGPYLPRLRHLFPVSTWVALPCFLGVSDGDDVRAWCGARPALAIRKGKDSLCPQEFTASWERRLQCSVESCLVEMYTWGSLRSWRGAQGIQEVGLPERNLEVLLGSEGTREA